MSDLISRQDLLKLFENLRDEHETNAISYVALYEVILKQPTIEAVPVVHGEWFLLDECANSGVYCSICYKKVFREQYANQKIKSNFCPNCGAMMKGGANQ